MFGVNTPCLARHIWRGLKHNTHDVKVQLKICKLGKINVKVASPWNNRMNKVAVREARAQDAFYLKTPVRATALHSRLGLQ